MKFDKTEEMPAADVRAANEVGVSLARDVARMGERIKKMRAAAPLQSTTPFTYDTPHPLVTEDGRVLVRPFRHNFYGKNEGPIFYSPRERQADDRRVNLETRQLLIDRLESRRKELLKKLEDIHVDPRVVGQARSADERGRVAQARMARDVAQDYFDALAGKSGRLARFFRTRWGDLYTPSVALRGAQARLAITEQNLQDAITAGSGSEEVVEEMQRINHELRTIDADLEIFKKQLADELGGGHAPAKKAA